MKVVSKTKPIRRGKSYFDATERALVEEVLGLANRPEVTAADWDAALARWCWRNPDGSPLMWPYGTLAADPARPDEDPALAPMEDQGDLERGLKAVAKSPRRAWAALGDGFRALLARQMYVATVELRPDGSVGTRMHPIGGEALYALAFALLADPARPFGRTLRRCALKECGHWYLALRGKAGGRPGKGCTDVHTTEIARLANAAKAARIRKAAKRGKEG